MQVRLLDAFFRDRQNGLIWATQVEPFNDFMRSGMNTVVDKHNVERFDLHGNVVRVRLVQFLCNARAHSASENAEPTHPRDVLGVAGATYAVAVRAKFTCEAQVNGVTRRQSVVVPFCRMPVMVGSDWCATVDDPPSFDRGGYFIINGKQRVIVAQENRATNKIMCINERSPSATVYCRNPTNGAVSQFEMRLYDKRLGVTHHFLKNAERNYLYAYDYLVACGMSCADARAVTRERNAPELTSEDALTSIGMSIHANRSLRGAELLRNTRRTLQLMLCHVEPGGITQYVAAMAERFWMFRDGEWEEDAEAHCKNKRYEMVNKLLTDMLFYFYDRYMYSVYDELKGMEVYTPDVVNRLIRFLVRKKDTISKSMCKWFTSGKWCIPGSTATKGDVCEMLIRPNYNAQLSQMLRITNGSDGVSKSKSDDVRLMHPSYRGFTCAVFIQDGKKTGISKELALFARFSRCADAAPVRAILEHMVGQSRYQGSGRVFLDGALLPFTMDVAAARDELVEQRRRNRIMGDVGISVKCNVLDVRCDEGRLVQTLLRVYNGDVPLLRARVDPSATWRSYAQTGWAETLDAEEALAHCRVYFGSSKIPSGTTHVVLHPAAIFGPIAAQVPFANRNQAPRLTYYTTQARQVVSLPYERCNAWATHEYHLWYGQKPLVQSKVTNLILPAPSEAVQYSDSASGVNAFVVIMCDQYNQEDSIVINKMFLERGALALTSFHRYTVDVDPADEEFVVVHDNETGLPMTNEYGVPRKGTKLRGGDVIVYKWTVKDHIDTSQRVGKAESGVVDDCMAVFDAAEKVWRVVVSVRTVRVVDEGHKAIVRQGQKTLAGDIRQQADMPVRERDGVAADILVNTHSMPTRMTPGYFLEMYLSTRAVQDGRVRDATPFETVHEIDVDLMQELQDGKDPGTEVFIDGTTGERMQPLYCGYIHMGRIPRFPESSAYARATGPVAMATGQPLQFRRKDGGMRNGEMEKDCLVAHGAARLIVDRMRHCADETRVAVCKRCGLPKDVLGNPCRTCGEMEETDVLTRRAFVLMMQELRALLIDLRFVEPT